MSSEVAATDSVPQQPEMTESEEVERLKYLEFVQVAALQAVLIAAKLYDYAKDNSGPLKPGVQTVEGTVKTIVGPVYNKFHDVPIELLKFVDHKVDESVNKVPLLKQVASDVKTAGVVETASGLAKTVYIKCEPAAKELYTKYEPVAEEYAVSAWRSLNKLPLFPQVAQTVIPVAALCSEKYNQTVQSQAEKGSKVASYLPLVPTDRIAKVFGPNGAEPVARSQDVAVN
jgi:hypothetical protein